MVVACWRWSATVGMTRGKWDLVSFSLKSGGHGRGAPCELLLLLSRKSPTEEKIYTAKKGR